MSGRRHSAQRRLPETAFGQPPLRGVESEVLDIMPQKDFDLLTLAVRTPNVRP